MKLLVIGGGAREHALAWKLLDSSRRRLPATVFVAPGNAGTELEKDLKNVPITTIPELIEFARKESIAFTVVGPEAPLAEGIVDAFRFAGLKIFGPTQKAAQLETSKDFAKAFMGRHGIPTADYATFSSAAKAHRYIDKKGVPIVIKADGLAAGKGVVVAVTLEEAHAAVDKMLGGKSGKAGPKIVIEEFVEGEEISFIVMTDGRHVLPLASSQDHKRLKDGDEGPNTGGMGAYSPASSITPTLHGKIMREVIQRTISGMEKEGERYIGFLYAGLMITPDGGIKVLEFNCRMGDPEAEVILLRLKSNFITLIEHALSGNLDKIEAEWDRRAALAVVMAASGYPDSPRKGDAIEGLSALPATLPVERDYHVFHAGTARGGENGEEIVTAGGRILCVAALGDNFRMAQRRAYEIAEQIHFDGCQMRRDIGYRAINHRK
ncbi:phosphoribosylamine--glycine ligase [Nitrosospira multiformis]|uniref:phosphoribosylamine--glycine ligase n=1 Tax=Nitrosospira multiformis TaxID=1231 RepID=UPI00089B5848|nr:phosphoribosylamine--glycine ligase [Nitrosospira multiformis]SEA61002.1 phosphoribosylamine--glycine ligase [Nitrosospira multiformis]